MSPRQLDKCLYLRSACPHRLRAVATCPSCLAKSPDGFRFCGACGAPLPLEASSEWRERRVVSVLFADLVGFTSRSERTDVEDVDAFLAPYLLLLRREINRHGGVVCKLMGDGVMAVFGAPTTRVGCGHETSDREPRSRP